MSGTVNEIRDKVLAILSVNFSADQLAMVDSAVVESLQDYKIEREETLPAVSIGPEREVVEFLARKKSKGLKEGTLVQYTHVLRAFCLCVRKPIHEITEWDVIKFLDDYERYRGVGKRRKDSMRVILNGFFRYMADSGRVSVNPMLTIEPIKYRKNVRNPLSGIELERLRRVCQTPKERALVDFFFATGCRVSEVVGIRKDDIDYLNRRVKVTGKGDKERYVFLNDAAILSLDEYFKSRDDRREAVFVSDRRPHQPLKKNAIERIFRILGERAGITRNVFPHLIRHTTATYLYRHGMRLEVLSVVLGHDSPDTTKIYAKDDPALVQNAYMMSAA